MCSRLSNLLCSTQGCGRRLSLGQEDALLSQRFTSCVACGTTYWSPSETRVLIDPSCRKFSLPHKQIPSDIFTSSWFHFTIPSLSSERPHDWLPRVQRARAWVHIGTRISSIRLSTDRSLERSAAIRNHNPLELYSLTLDSKSHVHPHIFEDHNEWPSSLDDRHINNIQIPDHIQVVRYVNAFEVPGQISLLVDPSILTVTNYLTLDTSSHT